MRKTIVSLLLIASLTACGTSPGADDTGGDGNGEPSLQASLGTYNTGRGTIETNVLMHTRTPGSTDEVEITIAGPDGWNGGDVATLDIVPGGFFTWTIDSTPVDGDYTITMNVAGTTYRDTATIDADSTLPPVTNVVITEATPSRISARWDPIAGARSYDILLWDADTGGIAGAKAVTTPSVTFDDAELATSNLRPAATGSYRIEVFANSVDTTSTTADLTTQFDRSYATSEPFTIPSEATTTVTLRVQYGLEERNAPVVAFQSGTGDWQAAEGTNGVYSLDVTDTEGRYGVAVVCDSDAVDTNIVVGQATTGELDDITLSCAPPSGPAPGTPPPSDTFTVSGTVTGLSAGEGAMAFAGQNRYNPASDPNAYPADPTYSLANLNSGSYDFVVLRGTDPGGTGAITPYDAAMIERNVEVRSDTTLDFDLANSMSLAAGTVTVEDLDATGTSTIRLAFASQLGTYAPLGDWMISTTDGNSIDFNALPGELLANGDLHQLFVEEDTPTTNYQKRVLRYFYEPQDVRISMPASFDPTVSPLLDSSYTRFHASWSAREAQAYSFEFTNWDSTHAPTVWEAFVSAGWLGTSTEYTLPDLSGIPGWDADWHVDATASEGAEWSATSHGGNVRTADLWPEQPDIYDFTIAYDGFEHSISTATGTLER